MLSTKKKNSNERGCCGIKVRVLLIDSADDPYLEVRECCLLATYKHLLMSKQGCKASKNRVINNEDFFTPRKDSFVEKPWEKIGKSLKQ